MSIRKKAIEYASLYKRDVDDDVLRIIQNAFYDGYKSAFDPISVYSKMPNQHTIGRGDNDYNIIDSYKKYIVYVQVMDKRIKCHCIIQLFAEYKPIDGVWCFDVKDQLNNYDEFKVMYWRHIEYEEE